MEIKTWKTFKSANRKTSWIVDFRTLKDNVDYITICGAGPSLRDMTKRPTKGIVIFINSAIDRFSVCVKEPRVINFIMCDKRFMRKSKSKIKQFLDGDGYYIAPNCSFVLFGGAKVLKYRPSAMIDKIVDNNRLRIGHSTLIPALHLSLMINPKKIWLMGVDLCSRLHWQDDPRFNRPKMLRRFPASDSIVKEVTMLLNKFNYFQIYSTSKRSRAVIDSLVKYESIENFERDVVREQQK